MVAQTPRDCINQIPPPNYVFRPEQIPASLSEINRWCNFYTEPKPDGRTNKLPCNAHGTKIDVASDNAAPNFRTFDAVTAALGRNPRLNGIGWILTDEDDITFIDVDHCRNAATGELTPEATETVRELDSFTEVSVSGTGLHIFARGDVPTSVKANGIEIYCRGRFATMTGQHLDGTPTTINRRPRQLMALYERLKPAKSEPKPKAEPKPTPAPTEPSTTSSARTWTDAELVEKASASKNGAVFARLWAGNCSDHGDDHSRADLDLLGKLLFWTSGDGYRADAMFRQSGLMREKWNEHHYENRETYGAHTLGVALASFDGNGYTGGRVYSGGAHIEDDTDTDGLPLGTIAQIDQLKALIAELRAENASLRAELKAALCLNRQNLALQQKPDKRERDSVLAALAEVESAKSRGQVDERGFVRLNLGEVARCSGFSRPTVSNHIRLAAASGLCEVETRPNGYSIVERDTGVITGYRPAIFAKFATDAAATRAAILEWKPERPKIGRPAGKRCTDHPFADVRVERHIDERRFCVVCDKLLSTEQTIRQTVETYTEPETEATEEDSEQTSEAIKYFTIPGCLPAVADEAPFTNGEPDSEQTVETEKSFSTPCQGSETSFPRTSATCGTTYVRSNRISLDTPPINLTDYPRCICGATATSETDGIHHCAAHPPSRLRPQPELAALAAVLS